AGRAARNPHRRARRARRPVPRPGTHGPALLRPHPESSARCPAPYASHALMRFVSRAVFQALAGSRSMKALASRYGLRSETSFARRFVAGESVADAIAAARRLEAGGVHQTPGL